MLQISKISSSSSQRHYSEAVNIKANASENENKLLKILLLRLSLPVLRLSLSVMVKTSYGIVQAALLPAIVITLPTKIKKPLTNQKSGAFCYYTIFRLCRIKTIKIYATKIPKSYSSWLILIVA